MSAHPSSAALRQLADMLDASGLTGVTCQLLLSGITRETLPIAISTLGLKRMPNPQGAWTMIAAREMDSVSVYIYQDPKNLLRSRTVMQPVQVFDDLDDAAETAAGGV